MSNSFISIAMELFPDALICIDMFHVIQHIDESVTEIRLRLQRDMKEQENKVHYRMLQRASKSLLVNECELNPRHVANQAQRKQHLETLFVLFPELATAYDALQEFHLICKEPEIILQRAALSDWLICYTSCNVPETEEIARSIRRWRRYIENAWEHKRSNSTCEGINNKIKVLKRVCFGMHSFKNCRKRILLTCGSVHLAKNAHTLRSLKTDGKGIWI